LDGHCSKVTAIQFTIDKQFILTASRDKLVIVWHSLTHQKIRSIPIFEVKTIQFILSSKYKIQFNTSVDNLFQSLESIQVIPSEKVSIINSVSKDKLFITAGERGILRIWNYETGDELYTQENSLLCLKRETDEQNDATINSQLIIQTIYCNEISQIAVISFENNIIFHKIEDLSLVKQV
jgi:U3 small nucleolar RNA-associated protein 13